MKSIDSYGSVIERTTHLCDLIPCFADLLLLQAETEKERAYIRACVEDLKTQDNEWIEEDNPLWESDIGQEILDELIYQLAEVAPPFAYFGTHPGDGCCYGFWLDEDSIQADEEVYLVAEDEIYSEELVAEAARSGHRYIYWESDHGNPNLVRITFDTEDLL